ncbi:hypothetical protein LXL04_018133 [Taraxacum kok-saghyz]
MAMLLKLFYKKPPEGLFDVCERIYVFDSCFRIKTWEQEEYNTYVGKIISKFKKTYPKSSEMVFNFREGDTASKIHQLLLPYHITIIDYPQNYEGCPLLSMEVINHFLKSSENWLSLGQHNVLLMHSELGGWPVLAFMSAALLLYRKHHTSANKALEKVYKQAPPDVLSRLMSPLNSLASQLRYLQYVLKRNDVEQWPPADKPLTLVCVMMRMVPDFDGKGGCCPVFRIYGRDPSLDLDKTPKLLFSTPRCSKNTPYYNQAEMELIKIDINFRIQGDVVLECINLHDDMSKQEIMYQAMFNTSFIKSYTLLLNRDEIDVSWDIKDQFPEDFKAELLFSERKPPPLPPPPPKSEDWPPPPAKKLMPLHWLKLNKVGQGSLWAEAEKSSEAARAPEIDMVELETLFLASEKPNSPNKPKTVQVIGHRRALSCEIMMSKVKTPLPELMEQVLNLDDSAMDVEQVETLIKFCPTKEEMELLNNYKGEHEMLGKCEQFFLELMKVPRAEEKLVVFSYKLQFNEEVSELRHNLEAVYLSVEQASYSYLSLQLCSYSIRSSVKLRRVMETILSLGNALNQGTTEGAAVGFKLDSLLKLNETCERSNKMTLMHCLCKVLADKLPELLDFSKELGSLENASKIQLKLLAEQMQGITKGLTKVAQEKKLCKKDGDVSKHFRKSLKTFLASAEPDVKELAQLYSGRGITADSLITYFGEDPAEYPYELVIDTLLKFVRMFNQAHDENCKQIEGEKKAAQIAAEQDRLDADESKTTAQRLPYLHWFKLYSVQKGSLWAEAEKSGEAARVPEINRSELETIFSALKPRFKEANKPEKIQLIDDCRAYCCEFMLSKVKTPLPELMEHVLNWDDSAMAVDEVDNLIKLCPTKEEMEIIKNYTGDFKILGKCEQFFLELMKVPRAEAKLIVFSFTLQFSTKLSELRFNVDVVYLSVVQASSSYLSLQLCSYSVTIRLDKFLLFYGWLYQIRSSVKLRRVMQTILSLGNALNQGTTRGAAVGFRLDSLLKLNRTRASNSKMTLMHYLCKVLADKLPELLDFSKELGSLEPASKIQLKLLAEQIQGIAIGLTKVHQEKKACKKDGHVSENFRKSLESFFASAEPDMVELAQLYSGVGKTADALIIYFGEDPCKCRYEKVLEALLWFVRMFYQAHDENCKQLESEKKAAQKEVEHEKSKAVEQER